MRAGDRAPDAPGLESDAGTSRLFYLLRGAHVTVLVFGSELPSGLKLGLGPARPCCGGGIDG